MNQGLCAQAPPAAGGGTGQPSAATAAQPAAKTETPLARYVARDHLIFYVEFAGLDAHADAWKKTAAQRMLNDTPLGAMLEDVAGQLLEKALSASPNRKVSGAELVTLIKALGRNGWVLALNGTTKPTSPFVGTLVLRGAAAKDMKPITSRMLGMLMGDAKPRIDRKSGRVLVVVPSGPSPEAAWVWWPEKEDLVIGPSIGDVEAMLGVIDGKTPSALDHAVIKELARTEGTFTPLMTALVDCAAPPEISGPATPKMKEFFDKLRTEGGIQRLDYRWGFDDDALASVTRLVAPAPRKGILTAFDQPPIDPKNLIPMPEGVESFVLMSLSPAKIIEAISQLGPAGQVKGKLDELMEKVKSQNRIDFDKDVFNNMGPKMVVYLAPGRSAATTDEPAPTAAAAGGFDPSAILSSLQGSLPKPTLVAELRDPTSFGKALDAIMVAVNRELKARAIEKAAEDAAAATATPPAGGGVPPGPAAAGRGRRGAGAEAGGERPARKRSTRETPAPEFQLMPGPVKTYMLKVPSESPLKIGSPGVRPTIRMEGHYLAISTSAESARTALEVTRKKGWKPSADIEQAMAHVPSGTVLLAVGDTREIDPPVLASLPVTLQAQINTMIAMSSGGTSSAGPAGAPGQGGFPGATPGQPALGGQAGAMARRGMGQFGGPPGGSTSAGTGQGQSAGRSGGPPPGYVEMMSRGGSGGQAGGAPGATAGSAPTDAMIQLKVDPAKLPKAEELKALMFPATWAVAADGQSVRVVSREAFPSVMGTVGSGAVLTALFLPAFKAARARAEAAAAGAPPPGQPAGAVQPPAVAPPASLPAAPGRGGPPGGAGGRGGRRRAESD
jgi:hypothetical protein